MLRFDDGCPNDSEASDSIDSDPFVDMEPRLCLGGRTAGGNSFTDAWRIRFYLTEPICVDSNAQFLVDYLIKSDVLTALLTAGNLDYAAYRTTELLLITSRACPTDDYVVRVM